MHGGLFFFFIMLLVQLIIAVWNAAVTFSSESIYLLCLSLSFLSFLLAHIYDAFCCGLFTSQGQTFPRAARWRFCLVCERRLNEEIMAAAPFVAQVLERCTVGCERAGVTRLVWRRCGLWQTLADRRTDKETFYMTTPGCTAANLHHRVHRHTYSQGRFHSLLLLWNNYPSLFKTFMRL